jgi:hypothetical protein
MDHKEVRKVQYLSVFLDLNNNEIIEFEVSDWNELGLVMRPLRRLIQKRSEDYSFNTIIHSDQGNQYTSIAYVVNLAYKWFVGLNPEDPLPDSSLLSLFRVHKIGAGEVVTLLTEIVKQCVEKGVIRSSAVIIDAAHTQSQYEPSKPLQVLKHAGNRFEP